MDVLALRPNAPMHKPLLPILLLALAVLATGIWLVSRGEGRSLSGTATRPQTARASKADSHSAAEPVPAPVHRNGDPGGPEAPALASSAEKPARVIASTEYAQELASGVWVEGRVVFPPGTPQDERVRVVAKGGRFKHGPAHSVEAAAAGTFRVAFPQGTATGRLALEGRYLYLDESLKVAPGSADPVVLEPRLGGVLRGRVLPPPDVEGGDRALIGRSVVLAGTTRKGAAEPELPMMRQAELGPSLAFEFQALSPQREYSIFCDASVYEPADAFDLLVEPGRETAADLQVLRGVSIAGRVLDEKGAPLEGARVELRLQPHAHFSLGQMRAATTGAAGEFAIDGASPGEVTLEVSARGSKSREVQLGRLERGAALTGVEVKLPLGRSISGRVLWPDATPAEGASVTAEPLARDRSSRLSSAGSFTTDASGAFVITGLEPGKHRVSARATHKVKVRVMSEVLGKEREKTVRTTLRASLAEADVGAQDVTLRLSDGEGFEGFIADDLGTPLSEFRIHAGLLKGDEPELLGRARTFSFEDARGVFTVSGLEAGRYFLVAEAERHVASAPLLVELPLEGELPSIRLARAALVYGVVITPDGAPAPGAQIETTGMTPEQAVDLRQRLREGSDPRRTEAFESVARTDAAGAFETYGAGQGTVKVRAVLPGFVPSQPLELALDPGVPQAPLKLQLGAGTTLTGVLLDAAGQPLPGRSVEISQRTGPTGARTRDGLHVTVTSNDAGAFSLAGVEPGRYVVVAPPTQAELASLGFSADPDAHDLLSARAEVDVTAGGAHAVLRVPAGLPIRLQGRITAGSLPIKAQLFVQPHARKPEHPYMWMRETDARGAFELLLPEPGTYTITLGLPQLGASVRREVAVTSAQDQRLDIDVPLGSISGRVYGPAGLLEGVGVALHCEDLEGEGGYARAMTRAGGSYAVPRLPAGTWTVQAGGTEEQEYGSPPSPYTRGSVEHVAVASGQAVEDVDLHLGAAGVISGRVLRADGAPAAGASIRACLPSGEEVEELMRAEADEQGSFSVGGLEPGNYVLGAFHGQAQGADLTVEVEAGKESRVEMRLAPASIVRVVARDAQGAIVNAQITCRRSDGADFSSWFSRSWKETPEGELRLGPLPPGTYILRADLQGAAPTTKTVTLKGEPEMLIELVL